MKRIRAHYLASAKKVVQKRSAIGVPISLLVDDPSKPPVEMVTKWKPYSPLLVKLLTTKYRRHGSLIKFEFKEE